MSRDLWYLTRASGIAAAILIVVALASGFFFSARETGKLRPAWWLDLHNWLGGLALAFTALHIGASFLDTNSGIGLVQVFVPGTAGSGGWGIGWGVIATYLFGAVVFTTWPRRFRKKRLWRTIHLTSVIGAALALLHSYQSGSDSLRQSFRIGILAAVAVSTYALGIRLFGLKSRGRRRSKPSDRATGERRARPEDSQRAHSLDSSLTKPPVAK